MMPLTWLTDLKELAERLGLFRLYGLEDRLGLARLYGLIAAGKGFPCLFHSLTGFYCPGCGGTRAVIFLLQGRLLKSLLYHPLVLLMAAALVTEGVLALMAWIRRRNYWEGFNRRYRFWVKLALAVTAVNFIIKNGCLLAGIDLMPLTRS